MDATTFLSAVWGPVLFATGIGFVANRAYFVQIYRHLEQSPLATLTFGMIAMSAGLAQVLVHNDWSTFAAGVVTFLGWGALLKGALFLMAPKFADKAGDAWVRMKLLPLPALLTLFVGAYLTWFAYIG